MIRERFFLDTEFIENGKEIHLISIGLTREDLSGAVPVLYMEAADVPWELANDWVLENVKPHLKGVGAQRTKEEMCIALRGFIGNSVRPEFWCQYGSWDFVAMLQLFGDMSDAPGNWSYGLFELMQYADSLGVTRHEFPEFKGTQHNALEDATWANTVWQYLKIVDQSQRTARARAAS